MLRYQGANKADCRRQMSKKLASSLLIKSYIWTLGGLVYGWSHFPFSSAYNRHDVEQQKTRECNGRHMLLERRVILVLTT
jgi:hypothetical protein